MKLKLFLLSAVSLLLNISADACGPFNPIIPTPEFFNTDNCKRMCDYDREENVRLWQQLTSNQIPLTDIEQAVYKDSQSPENLFYTYIHNTDDSEISDFLYTAKNIESKRGKMQSPWYYPRDRKRSYNTDDFRNEIEWCQSYRGTRLKDRYALQVVRALFASRLWEECIEYCDTAFASFPESNLMKRMARRYMAGCWSRLGDSATADSIFAACGDIWSLSVDNKVEYMARHNPDAPQIIEYIRHEADDSCKLARIVPTAHTLLKNSSVRHRGDWAYLLAYYYNEYAGDLHTASRYINRALQYRFSTPQLRDLAHAYKMKLDARNGYIGSLADDLKWIESQCDNLNPEADEWIRRVRNVIYVDWVPRLWKQGDYAIAVMLAAYADNISPRHERQPAIAYHATWYRPIPSITLDEMRASEIYNNTVDYGSLSFQMMGSMTSAQLAATYNSMMTHDNSLYRFIRNRIRTDADYYNELIGTLALREENYPRAIQYLSKVSKRYQHTMNLYKDGYLSDNAKLDFAREMLGYRQLMSQGRTPDDRGMARLEYAIRRNNSSWALTRYWDGEVGIFQPSLQYWVDDSFAEDNYTFLYEYDPDADSRTYEKEVEAALAMLVTDEARARAQYMLGNLKTVIRKYPDTETARRVKTSCDNWQSWL